MLQPVGGMDRIAHAIYEQVKPRVRLNTPVTRDPPRRAIGCGSSMAREPGDRSRLLRLHAAAADLLERIPQRFLAREESGARGRRLICTSVKLAFEAPRFWETRR